MREPLGVVILGSTGSVGTQTLDVAASFPDRIRVLGLAANRNLELLMRQVEAFWPARTVLVHPPGDVPESIETGAEAMIDMVRMDGVDLVVVATVGAAGLMPTLAALDAGKRVALANKETLVMAGSLFRRRLKGAGSLVPIDSEHSAIWQCLLGEPEKEIEKLVLTASGGPFRRRGYEDLHTVTPAEALKHPTWNMGPKVTVDSASLMNKGLEVLEAAILFDVGLQQVEVVQHPESIVHSLVYFTDSSVKAQLGVPDMRLPIQFALSYPHRWPNELARLDLASTSALHFGPIDLSRYPCLRLALEAGAAGGTAPATLCAADDVGVGLFLDGDIRFTDIPIVVEAALARNGRCENPGLDDILQADATAREAAYEAARRLRL
ncbi:MAG TPA: 1-deoxy-D-xylulose-5-phosphate reductoisomerase [Chloroflexota bacterium]|nr:1-deoxy-D-xylulose-5-phosphate reductoisomerase [Chloroflexota bacterium]